MARTVKTLSCSAVNSGVAGAKPQSAEKAEDFIRDTLVKTPNVSQVELLKAVSLKFPQYGYSSFKIAYSRYTAVMREVLRVYDIKLKSANVATK